MNNGMVFKFATGAHLSGDPQIVGEALMNIREIRGRLIAADVLEVAKPLDNALHRYFEWDDAAAAEQHRLSQARLLVRSVVLVETSQGEIRPIRAFAKVTTEEINSYEPIGSVMADKTLREAVLREVRSEIKSLREKVATFEELGDVLSALDRVDEIAAQIEIRP